MDAVERIKIKVCGLTRLDQADTLALMDVDFLGFVFYPKSARFVLNQLTLEQIKSAKHRKKVGVFVNEDILAVIDIVLKAQLNFVQLHGNESPEYVKELRSKLNENVKIIKVFRVGDRVLQTVSYEEFVDCFLFDTDSPSFGGTGKTFDWLILNRIKINRPYFLSGGISAESLSDLAQLNNKPFAVDINSRFETAPGNKNIDLIQSFKKQLKTACNNIK